jgi:WD40 repeat protein
VAFSRDSRMAAIASPRYTVQLIDMATFRAVARLELPAPEFLGWLCFSPDGAQLAAAGEHHTIQLWDLRAIRRRLADMGLDWELPQYPPLQARGLPRPLSAKVVLKETNP